MGVVAKVKMKMCKRIAGEVKCVDDAYYAEYESRTVGPVKVELKPVT